MDHLIKNRRMVAVAGLQYSGADLRPGDSFYATDVDADYMLRSKRAKEASVIPTPAPTLAPTPAPTTAPAAVETADILDLSVAKASPMLAGLSVEQLQDLRKREEGGKTRVSMLEAIDNEIAAR